MVSIQRRHFLRQAARSAVAGSMAATTAAATTAVAVSSDKVNQLGKDLDQLGKRLEERIDGMEHHQRNALRAGIIFMAVSTGVDLSLII